MRQNGRSTPACKPAPPATPDRLLPSLKGAPSPLWRAHLEGTNAGRAALVIPLHRHYFSI